MTHRQKLLKTLSGVLALSFIFQDFAMADLDLLKAGSGESQRKENLAWATKLLPSIPESIAVVEDAWRPEDSSAIRDPKSTILLIQDAHTNNSGQINVARLLDIILSHDPRSTIPAWPAGRHDPSLVFLEAGQGDESLSFLRKYASEDKRKRVGLSFLMQGKLQGTEYLDLVSKHNLKLWGVEDMSLYKKSLETYKKVVKDRDKFEEYLTKIESTIKTLKPKVYNPFLLSFDKNYQKYQKEEIPLTAYYDLLMNEAKTLELSLSLYPHLKALNKLKELESRIDFKKASEEEEKAVLSLSPQDQKELFQAVKDKQSPFRVSATDNKVQKAFFSLLEEKLPNSARNADYPNLFKYLHYLKEARRIQAKSILEEQKALERALFKALTRDSDEENLLKASKNLSILKKLLNLTLTPDEYEE